MRTTAEAANLSAAIRMLDELPDVPAAMTIVDGEILYRGADA
jgi:hypothetical protein